MDISISSVVRSVDSYAYMDSILFYIEEEVMQAQNRDRKAIAIYPLGGFTATETEVPYINDDDVVRQARARCPVGRYLSRIIYEGKTIWEEGHAKTE